MVAANWRECDAAVGYVGGRRPRRIQDRQAPVLILSLNAAKFDLSAT
jgi:hypothetical protein